MDERQKEKEKFARGATGDAFRGRHRWGGLRNPNSEFVPRVTKAQRWLVVQSFLSPEERAAGRVLDPKDFTEVSDSQVRILLKRMGEEARRRLVEADDADPMNELFDEVREA